MSDDVSRGGDQGLATGAPALAEIRTAALGLASRVRSLPAGTVVDDAIEISQSVAQRLLRSIIHFVADFPPDAPPEVVWQLGRSELLVHTDTITVSCTKGLVRVGLDVECDEIDGSVTVVVPLAVGTDDDPRGLIMSTFSRIDAPDALADTWSDAISAFAWEGLLELARRLCAEAGSDSRGRALIPVEIISRTRKLSVRPMARHDATIRGLTARGSASATSTGPIS